MAKASPSTSSATMRRLLPASATLPRMGSRSLALEIFFVDQDVAVLIRGHAVVSDEVAQVALVELHALHEFHFGFQALAFHGDDAVLTHFVHGFGNDLADLGILVNRWVPTWRSPRSRTGLLILASSLVMASTPMSIPRLTSWAWAPVMFSNLR